MLKLATEEPHLTTRPSRPESCDKYAVIPKGGRGRKPPKQITPKQITPKQIGCGVLRYEAPEQRTDSLKHDWRQAQPLIAKGEGEGARRAGAGAQEHERNPNEARRLALLSVVIPCFNEEPILAEAHRRLALALEGCAPALELIYVDDGSRDGTLDVLRGLQRDDDRVRVVVLSRNFGQETALTAGLANAAGDAVALIDADMQDPPETLAEMLRQWRDGADVAYGLRTRREGETVFKRWTAAAFYRLLGRLAETDVPLDTGNFRLMDRRVVDALLAMPERYRFTRGLVAWMGFRQVAVPFLREPRAGGETKYPLRALLRLAIDGLLSFSNAPLRLAFWLGLLAAVLALLGVVYVVAMRLFAGVWADGGMLLLIAVLFLGGIQLVFIGVLGEYVGRIDGEVRRRPLYFVRERLGFASVKESSETEPADAGRNQPPS